MICGVIDSADRPNPPRTNFENRQALYLSGESLLNSIKPELGY